MQLSIAWLALRGIMMLMRMRQRAGFYAMKQHTDRKEARSGELLKLGGKERQRKGAEKEKKETQKEESADVFSIAIAREKRSRSECFCGRQLR